MEVGCSWSGHTDLSLCLFIQVVKFEELLVLNVLNLSLNTETQGSQVSLVNLATASLYYNTHDPQRLLRQMRPVRGSEFKMFRFGSSEQNNSPLLIAKFKSEWIKVADYKITVISSVCCY